MHIAIDIRSLQTPGSRDRGIGYSLRGWLTEFLQMPYQHQVTLMFDPRFDPPATDVPLQGDYWRAVPFESHPESRLPDPEAEHLARRNTEQFLLDHEVDLFHMPSPFETSVMVGYPPRTCRCVATFHDALLALFPELYLQGREEPFVVTYYTKLQALRYCTRIAAVSESAANDLVKLTGTPAEQVDVIYHAASADMFIPPSPEEMRESKLLQAIGPSYIFSVLGSNPTKNVERLIAAYSQLPAEMRRRYKLVITYRIPGWQRPIVQSWLEKYRTEGRVLFTDFVSRTDLRLLFANATLYVHPALYEGFGMPIIEAMALGAPVIVSNTGPMPEIVGDAALLVDPYSVDDIASAIRQGLDDPALRRKLGRQAADHARLFDWKDSAVAMRSHYEKALAARSTAISNKDGAYRPIQAQLTNLSDLKELADVTDQTYEVRSQVPLVGPFIVSVRRQVTRHLREQYFDPLVGQQVVYNHRLIDAVGRVWQILEARKKQLERFIQRWRRDDIATRKNLTVLNTATTSADRTFLGREFHHTLQAINLILAQEDIFSQAEELAEVTVAVQQLASRIEEYAGHIETFQNEVRTSLRSVNVEINLQGHKMRARRTFPSAWLVWLRRQLTLHLVEPYIDRIFRRQTQFNQHLIECLRSTHTITSADLQKLEQEADIALRQYVVRSKAPVIGPLIAWVRSNLTSHLRGPYIDPIVERQVSFNRALLEALGVIHQCVVELRLQEYYEASISNDAIERQIAQLRQQLDGGIEQDSSIPQKGIYMLIKLLLAEMSIRNRALDLKS